MENHLNTNKIPTAEEFLDNFLNKYAIPWSPEIDKVYGCINTAMIEFAKLHVEAALKEAEKETVKHISKTILELNMYNKNSILNAYPLENIK